ncbi:MAG TPA: ribonuclease E inhibitor RraB [Nocardioidaceae bacterium]|nr:ribonuclease E inhibitor RraB [Nocardioidaceae bacterium]
MSGELERQLEATAELVCQRLSMGDRAEVPREVDHSATFRTQAAAKAAAAALATLGYDLGVHRRWFRTVVEFTHVTAVDHNTAAAFTREVIPVIEQHGGEYDGWGATLEE